MTELQKVSFWRHRSLFSIYSGTNQQHTGCISCHMSRADRDYTFAHFKCLLDTRG